MSNQPVSEEKIKKLLSRLPVKEQMYFKIPNRMRNCGVPNQADIHIFRVHTDIYVVSFGLCQDLFLPVEDDDPLHIILPRGEIMDIIADETKTFNCIERLAEFVFTLMTCKSCKICDIDFVGFSIDDMVCNSCYMKMKTKDFNKSDALCIVCHNEGDELDEKSVMTTPCCNKVLCLSCRSKIKPKVINSKIKIPCPTCREALPELSHDTMLTNFSILNLTT